METTDSYRNVYWIAIGFGLVTNDHSSNFPFIMTWTDKLQGYLGTVPLDGSASIDMDVSADLSHLAIYCSYVLLQLGTTSYSDTSPETGLSNNNKKHWLQQSPSPLNQEQMLDFGGDQNCML